MVFLTGDFVKTEKAEDYGVEGCADVHLGVLFSMVMSASSKTT